MTAIQIQALVTVIAPFLIQAAKKSQSAILGWISENNKITSIVISFVTALGTSLGLGLHHTAGQLVLTYPDLSTAMQGFTGLLVSTLVQFLAQGSIYDQIAKHVLPTKQGAKQDAAITALGGTKV